jgi:asparagine synthase (glutamine-hydrolysing)
MCGIIAIAGNNVGAIDESKVRGALSTLSLRGPDDIGFEFHDRAVIGQTRLSIVDLARGHQPMRDNEKPLSIVFNGEIYGYKELRDSLIKKGRVFSTDSDTEVILKAYIEYGPECVEHIDGMFAFAIWDENKKELFVARDRFGKKPFYYALIDGMFFGASEIKAIFKTGLIKGEIDPQALDDYLRLMYIPPWKTIYKNIRTLPPAHAGIVKGGKLESWRYWDIEKKPISVSYDEAKKKIRELFDDAVKKRMVADVEIGSLLSGGVDSTLVTLYAQKYSRSPIKTFSVGYEGHKNELPYALEASKKIGTDHRTIDIRANLADELTKIVAYMDEPHGDSSNFPQAMISELASSKVKVALTGDGADELFLGYGWYQKYWHTPRWRCSRIFGNTFTSHQKATTVFDRSERARLLKNPPAQKDETETGITGGLSPMDKANAFDLKVYLPGQLLAKIDRTSMMHSLEVRSPFLDTKLAEFVYNLPLEYKLSKSANKIILKDILSETFSKEYVYRRKQGFGAPLDLWLKKDSMRALCDSLLDGESGMYAYIDKAAVRRVKENFYAGKANTANKLWVIMCLALWFKTHSDTIKK